MKYVWLITLAVVGSALCWGNVSAQCVVGYGPPPGQPAAPCYIAPPQPVDNSEYAIQYAKELAAVHAYDREMKRRFDEEYAAANALGARGYEAQARAMILDTHDREQAWVDGLGEEEDAASKRAERIVDQKACARGERALCRW
jgi:hypothetical protein